VPVVRIVILGAGGLLATGLCRVLSLRHEVIALQKSDLDVTDDSRVSTVVGQYRPDVIISAAAYMNADRCETRPDLSYAVNTVGARNVAAAARQHEAQFVWFSTDFVFDGRKRNPYSEEDLPNPLMTYGVAKLAGEREVALASPCHYIVRTASLFGPSEKPDAHFVARMRRRAAAGERLEVVDDIRMSPTFTMDLARVVEVLITDGMAFGLYHVVNAGSASWHDLCRVALAAAGLNADLERIRIADRPEAAARRPLNTELQSSRLPRIARELCRPWQDALQDYIASTS
jgi:dTDP-4-dehydrorhamnose reductase